MNPAESQDINFYQEMIDWYTGIRDRILVLNSEQGKWRQGGVSHRYTLFDGIYRPHGMCGLATYFTLHHSFSVDPSDSPIEQISLIIQDYVVNRCIFIGIGNSQTSIHPIWGRCSKSWEMWQLWSDVGISRSFNGRPSKLIPQPDKVRKLAQNTLHKIDKFLGVLEA